MNLVPTSQVLANLQPSSDAWQQRSLGDSPPLRSAQLLLFAGVPLSRRRECASGASDSSSVATAEPLRIADIVTVACRLPAADEGLRR
eukprot:320567-Prymnesium_polylepis.1